MYLSSIWTKCRLASFSSDLLRFEWLYEERKAADVSNVNNLAENYFILMFLHQNEEKTGIFIFSLQK